MKIANKWTSYLIVFLLVISFSSMLVFAIDSDGDGYDDLIDAYPDDPSKWTEYWARAHYDLVNSGKTDEFGPTALDEKWQVNLGANSMGSPVIMDGYVYVNCYQSQTVNYLLKCLNAETGAEVWSFISPDGTVCSPSVKDEKVYFGTNWGAGTFYCLNALTGSKIWESDIGGDVYTAAPLINNGIIYISKVYGSMIALDASDGSEIWTQSVGNMHSSPAYKDGVIYVSNSAVNALTGSIIWTSSYRLESSPVIQYNRVYGQTHDKTIVCLNASTGIAIWSDSQGEYGGDSSAITCTPCVANYRVYFGNQMNNIFCYDAVNGDQIWNKTLDGVIVASPVASGNSLVYFYANSIYIIDPATGNTIDSEYMYYGSSRNTPTIYDGCLYASTSGQITCFGGTNDQNDIDGDGVFDDIDALPNDNSQSIDADGDWHGDSTSGNEPDDLPNDPTQWSDADGDGYGDNELGNNPDAFPDDATEWIDSDGDGTGDNSDFDNDNDGVDDVDDAFPEDPTQWSDIDGDGYGDNPDGNYPDHFPNIWGNSTLDFYGMPDDDGDGWSNSTDALPNDPTQWSDADGDGYGDNPDGNNPDALPDDPTQWNDADGDGYGDNPAGNNPDAFPDDPTEWADTDGDGLGDNADFDNDNDGYDDANDSFPNEPTQWSDADGDGYGDNPDGNNPDAFPNDRREWKDSDGDGIGDRGDEDDDNDGMPDEWELRYGFNITNSEDAHEDPDGDGYDNLREYVEGTNPLDIESKPIVFIPYDIIFGVAVLVIMGALILLVVIYSRGS